MDFTFDPIVITGFDPMFDTAVGYDYGYGFDGPVADFGVYPGAAPVTLDSFGYDPAGSLEPLLDAYAPSWTVPEIDGLPSVEALNQYVDNSLAVTGFQLDQAVDQAQAFDDRMQIGIDELNADGRFDDYLDSMDRQDARMAWNTQQDINNSWAQTNAESNAAADQRAQDFRDQL